MQRDKFNNVFATTRSHGLVKLPIDKKNMKQIANAFDKEIEKDKERIHNIKPAEEGPSKREDLNYDKNHPTHFVLDIFYEAQEYLEREISPPRRKENQGEKQVQFQSLNPDLIRIDGKKRLMTS